MLLFGHPPSYKCRQSLVIGAHDEMALSDPSRALVAHVRPQSPEQRASYSQCRDDGLMALRQVVRIERRCQHVHMARIFVRQSEQREAELKLFLTS